MKLLEYIVVHMLATPYMRWITKGDLEMWHMGPRDLDDGRVKFKGRIYQSREDLPLVKINGVWVKHLHGRGWDRLGYADLLHYSGWIENITPYNKDNFVDSDEITWGAVGINSVSRHIAIEGGIHPATGTSFGKHSFDELYSHRQRAGLEDYLKQAIFDHPQVKVIGHYQVPGTNKSCPGFYVPQFGREIGLPKENYIDKFKIA